LNIYNNYSHNAIYQTEQQNEKERYETAMMTKKKKLKKEKKKENEQGERKRLENCNTLQQERRSTNICLYDRFHRIQEE